MYNEILKPAAENYEILATAKRLIAEGFCVLPCIEKEPVSRIKSWSTLRKRPLSEKNYQYYFDEASQLAIICGETKDGGIPVEAIDVDSHNDLSGKLNSVLLAAIKYSIPDVFNKLVIEVSAKGGLHFLYRCGQVGSNDSNIARRPATAEELAKGERSLVLIETRGTGGYIVCSPSPGYKTIQGELDDIQEISPEERELLLNICRSFDQTGKLELPGLSKKKLDAPDAPWTVFNQKHDHTWIAESLQKAGWTILEETDDLIRLLRPGAPKSKSSGSIWKESNCLYLFSSSTEFEAGKSYSAFGVYSQLMHDGNWKSAARELGLQGIGTWKERDHDFYSINENGKLEIKTGNIGDWLKEIGIKKCRYTVNQFELVQVIDNVVDFISYDVVKKLFLDSIEKDIKTHDPKIFDVFANKSQELFSEGGGIVSRLDDLDENQFLESTHGNCWFFFKNTDLLAMESEKKLLPYNELKGLVWKNQIKDKDYGETDVKSDAETFIELVCSKKDEKTNEWKRRPEKEDSLKRGIGYGIDKYKDPALTKALILTDEDFDEDNINPEGGSGKDLLCNFIAEMRNHAPIAGKKFDPNNRFSFQGINKDTEVVIVRDLKKRFDFESLFNVLTDELCVEYKGISEIRIPYSKSPKWIFTANYTMRGSSGSHQRRKHEIEISSYFSKNHTPSDEFGYRLIDNWNDAQWKAFYNFMISCLQLFLKKGLGKPVTETLQRKQLVEDTNSSFVQWMDLQYDPKKGINLIPNEVGKEDFKAQFISKYPDFGKGKSTLSTTKFTQWVKRWSDEFGFIVDTRHADNRGEMQYKFTHPKKASEPIVEEVELIQDDYEIPVANRIQETYTEDPDAENIEGSESDLGFGALLEFESAPNGNESAPDSQNCTESAPINSDPVQVDLVDVWKPVAGAVGF